MESKELIEGNRIIAEFMEMLIDKEMPFECYGYDNEWNDIMPVVEKIASLLPDDFVHFEIGKRYTRCNLWSLETGRTHTFDESRDTFIETVWVAVVKFIKHYNSQPV